MDNIEEGRGYKVYLDGVRLKKYSLKVMPKTTFRNGAPITYNIYLLDGKEVWIDKFADKYTVMFSSTPIKV